MPTLFSKGVVRCQDCLGLSSCVSFVGLPMIGPSGETTDGKRWRWELPFCFGYLKCGWAGGREGGGGGFSTGGGCACCTAVIGRGWRVVRCFRTLEAVQTVRQRLLFPGEGLVESSLSLSVLSLLEGKSGERTIILLLL